MDCRTCYWLKLKGWSGNSVLFTIFEDCDQLWAWKLRKSPSWNEQLQESWSNWKWIRFKTFGTNIQRNGIRETWKVFQCVGYLIRSTKTGKRKIIKGLLLEVLQMPGQLSGKAWLLQWCYFLHACIASLSSQFWLQMHWFYKLQKSDYSFNFYCFILQF